MDITRIALCLAVVVLALRVSIVPVSGSESTVDSRKVKVAGLVVPRLPYEREENFRVFERLARSAAKAGAKMVCTPEGFLEGYIAQDKSLTVPEYRSLCETIPDGEYVTRIRSLAKELDIYIVAAFAEKDPDRQYNSAILVGPDGKVIGTFRKVHTADDEPLNTTGSAFPVLDTPVARVGMMICYDRQLPESPRMMAVNGVQIIFNPSAGMYGGINGAIMVTRAYENGVYILFVHPEDCLIIDPHGNIVARYKGEDRVVVADLDLSMVGTGPIGSRKPALYRGLTE